MKRAARILGILIVLAALLAGGAFYWGHQTFHNPGPLKTDIRLVIPKGSGLTRVGAILFEHDAILHPDVFVWGARLSGEARDIRAGEYDIGPALSSRQILTLLISGKTVQRQVTIPEGLTSHEISALLNRAPALTDAASIRPEGSLLPETYSYQYGDTRQKLVRRMERSMRDTVADLWAKRAKGLPIETPAQAVILASIVEKETGIAEERARVAAVFINRLRKKMRLQSDPTVIYGITLGRRPLGRPLSRKDLATKTPYNTYTITALPPGPICNPGREAIAAVLNPIESDEYYFVADGTGGHVFAKTLAEHNRNVARWRRLQKRTKP